MDKFTIRHTTDDLPFQPRGRAVALGLFDGVHEGHVSIIKAMVRHAAANSLKSCVQTFINMPKSAGTSLTTTEEKLEILTKLGVDEMLVLDYNAVKDIAAEEFISDYILIRMGADAVYAGEDYRFGKGASGDVELMKTVCGGYGISVNICPELTRDGRIVSSSWLRELLAAGAPDKYAELCGGRFFSYRGIVVKGKQMGRLLGFPTANIVIPEDKFTARRGVYASRIRLGSRLLYGVTNIGLRPTLENNATQDICETYIFDFDEDIYGAEIRVELVKFLRDETLFAGTEELKAAVEENKRQARVLFEV